MSRRISVALAQVAAPGARLLLEGEGYSLALFNVEGQFYAIGDSCPHQGSSLCGGKLQGRVIQCGAHGLRFDLASGYLLNSTQLKVPTYPVEVEGEQLHILVPPQESAP
ncbi:Rieske (2Fe-2S) protein [Pseudomonas sp. NPDC077649]|jgi:nitrite reductase/ring-hydroxylating ferredoxin subunit|uniref:Rieske (2Fe-2S) protein n=1 Tax=unclassified Pseudomonas TaxID=196821 RepID=UPI000397F10B|nr:Rieske 2Fe-2S domain-containing protein [Pseudomonas sp. EGD-AK9]ERI52976.1 hypothetical protein N878_17005 [Pseudomonas sp. EGD-AK9]